MPELSLQPTMRSGWKLRLTLHWARSCRAVSEFGVCARHSEFESEVKMWVFEEQVNGRPLTEIINETKENVKCAPSTSCAATHSMRSFA